MDITGNEIKCFDYGKCCMVDNFEIMGMWWLPENDKKQIPGILKFVADKEIELEIMGTFYESQKQYFQNEQPMHFDIILGRTNKGDNLTLLGPEEKGINCGTGAATYITSSFRCYYILKGIHFLSVDDIKFTKMSVSFTFLDDWLYPKVFKHEGTNAIRYDSMSPRNIRIEKINSIISIDSFLSSSYNFKTVSMSVRSKFIINPIEGSKDLMWYNDIISCLANFLTLVIGKPIYPQTKTAYLLNNDEIDIIFVVSNILYIKDIHFSQMMLPYKDLTSYLDKFLNNWFDYSDMLKPVYDLFFGTYYAKLYPNFYFLSLIQAIEAFHRRIYGEKGEYMTEDEYEPLRAFITNSIPPKFPDGSNYPIGFKDALKSKIKYGHEYSLRTRLKQLLIVWGPLYSSSDENLIEFNHNVVCTRNYLTHYEKAPDCRVFEGDCLILINLILKSILLIILLTHMGIPKLDAFRVVRKYNKRYNNNNALENAINGIF